MTYLKEMNFSVSLFRMTIWSEKKYSMNVGGKLIVQLYLYIVHKALFGIKND